MDTRIVFFDVDGTLLSFDTHRVPESAAEALRQAHNSGVKIIIATGRCHFDLNELGDLPYDGIASLNGADCVLRDGTHISRHPIGEEDFLKVLALSEEYGFPLAFVTDDNWSVINRITPEVEDLSRLVAHPLPQIVDLKEEYYRKGTCQLCIYCSEEMEAQIMPLLPSLTVSRWNPHFADVNVRGVDKALAVKEFCSYYGLDISQSAAIGDGGNDIPMIREAGVGIAMGNASDTVKAAANFVTRSVDDHGIRTALSHLGLI